MCDSIEKKIIVIIELNFMRSEVLVMEDDMMLMEVLTRHMMTMDMMLMVMEDDIIN
jgi:hypothetical protein